MNPTLQKIWGAIETVLRRHPWAVTLLAMVPCAFFSAAMVNDVVVANVLKADVAALSRPGGGTQIESTNRPAAEALRSRDTDQMLRRNVFDADSGCLNCPPPPPPIADAGASIEGDDSAPPQPCEGSVKIMGAVESEDPTWSFVFAMATAGQPTMPFRLGQTMDTKTIASIGWAQDYGAYVILRQQGGPRCFYAQIMPPRPPPPQVAAAPVASPTAEPGDALSQILEQGIVRESGNQFTLRRSTVDRILENQGELMRTTRVMPHMEGGRIAGLTLFGVRQGTLLGRIGLVNGDVLTRLNGLEIASPDKALEAYARLRSADRLTVSVLRNGAPVNIDFTIRP